MSESTLPRSRASGTAGASPRTTPSQAEGYGTDEQDAGDAPGE